MAGGKGSVFSNDLLQLILNGTAIPGVADNAATSPLANLYLSLHTSDPGVVSDQSTSEATYQGYARQAVSRDTTGFTVSGRIASLAERMLAFPPGACVMDQPDEVQQLVMTTGQDYWTSVSNGEIPADQYVLDAQPDQTAIDDETPPPDTGGNGNGTGGA